MSKKHPNSHAGGASHLSHEAEYRIIKTDLYKVLGLNIVYLVVILSLYYTDKTSHYLTSWFAKLLHF